ncbi:MULTISPECIES: type IV secretion system protein [unclassified Rhizobium]|uniref:virB8 family protein n=1 Tax=unclassified Rhizobium TaxID=2613769 RepID=UPI001616129C|nr:MULTISPECIES: type IV secretion system protein [unclassified Rhizobium]MBB3545302.1 type IV secretion system protein VirB8 [Rhizobium sp. BK399]MCS4096093.1 type IV secretion system protein VirB8 [Rhizobium sp. BK176]
MADTKELDLRTYYQSGDIWEQEIVKKAKRSRTLAWLVTSVFAGITVLALSALVLIVPLKSFEPYIVEVDRNTGYVEVKSGLTRPASLTDQQAITQANIVRYIRSREGYDPYAIEENFGVAALLSTGNAARELKELYSAANAKNPARVFGKNRKVTTEIASVTFPNSSTGIVRFSTSEISDTDTITRHWIAVVRYRYTDTPATNEWRFENPLGFQVYDYRRDQETVTENNQ